MTATRRFISAAEILEPSRFAIDFSESRDRTIQSEKENCDINVIVKRFGLTGQVRAPNVEPFYGDFTGVDDYQSAMNMLVEAKRSFMELPSEVRARFGNDPSRLIDFVNDDRNLDEARALGLCRPQEPDPAPMRVEVVNPPNAPGEGA